LVLIEQVYGPVPPEAVTAVIAEDLMAMELADDSKKGAATLTLNAGWNGVPGSNCSPGSPKRRRRRRKPTGTT